MHNRITYFKSLDSLRTIAVLMVVFLHFLPDANVGQFGIGQYGVDVFFTISGFLITTILLHQKYSDEKRSNTKILKNFYIRRSLRIFPIYFLLLFVLFCLQKSCNIVCWHEHQLKYFVTYTPNILFFFKGFQGHLTSHFWSLGVEEQFYLLWPWIIVFVRKKYLKIVITTFIITGILFHVIGVHFNFLNIRFLPFSNFHTLGVGILLAYLYFTQNVVLFQYKRHNTIFLVLSLLFFILNFYFFQARINNVILKSLVNECLIIFFTFNIKLCSFQINTSVLSGK
jgi:peptidoglycan/LPS O-acetylase OafA/YrhL